MNNIKNENKEFLLKKIDIKLENLETSIQEKKLKIQRLTEQVQIQKRKVEILHREREKIKVETPESSINRNEGMTTTSNFSF